MFFNDERLHFFRPLTSKYRAQIAQCLVLLYQRQYSSNADYGQSLTREQLLEIVEEALAHSQQWVFDDEDNQNSIKNDQRFKNHREQANWILKQLLDTGWIERQVDPATLQSSFPFTRMGRIFSQSLLDAGNTQIRTRHRNTRNTLNALEAFISREEIYDLLDAYEYSERIITDFTDVISELEERKRALVREVESQQLVQQATDHFFEFMEKRFQPDIAVRLSADSVEKHRQHISKAINKIRKKDKKQKQLLEQQLRRTVPGLCDEAQSYLWFILDHIEQRMRNASETMLPALRRALHSFTKRADIIIRQLSYLNSHHNNDLLEICKELSDLSEEQYQERLSSAAEAMAGMKVQLIDPQQIKLHERRFKQAVDSSIIDHHEINETAQRDLMIDQLLDQAFMINNQHLKNYISKALREGNRISTSDLPVNNALDLLAMAHIIELGAINRLSTELQFHVEYANKQVKDSEFYHSYDEFYIELISAKPQTRINDTTLSLDDNNEERR